MTEKTRELEKTPISLPLYAGGLIVTLCGVLVVSVASSQGDDNSVGAVAVLLTLLGFAFSLACRYMNVQARWIEIGCLALVGYIAFRLAQGSLDLDWFLGGADRNDMRLAAGLMWASVLRSWTLSSDGTVMFSCVLTAAMVGLIGTQDVNTITVVLFGVFVLAMVFLLIHQQYLHSRALASSRERAQGFAPVLPLQVGLTLLCGLLVLGVGSALIVPAQAVFANVSLAQAIRGLVVGTGHVPDADTASVAEQFSDGRNLTIGSGSSWPTSSDVLLYVTPSDGQPHYWRGRTYDLYLGNGWQSTQNASVPVTPSDQSDSGRLFGIATGGMRGEGFSGSAALPRQPLVATFDVRGITNEFYYADEPHGIYLDSQSSVTPHAEADGRLDLDGRQVSSVYTVTSLPPPDWTDPTVQERLRRDGTDYPPLVTRLYLGGLINEQNAVTTTTDIALFRRALASALRRLPPGRRTPFDKAAAIRDWVANRCVYSLAVAPLPNGDDHVRSFLFDTRKGYCDMFASSMVVLCRLAGIPARMATGFAPGDRDGDGYNLRAMDKHAWVEVYFPGDRWQIFDPTAGSRTDGTLPVRRTASYNLWPRLLRALTVNGPVPALLGGIIALLLVYIVTTELSGRIRAGSPRRAVPVREDAVYGRLTRSLARLGLPRRPWETPSEYEARALPFLASLEADLSLSLHPEMLSEATARFVAARYGGQPELDDSAFRRSLSRFLHAAARARRALFWRRLLRLRAASVVTARS